MADLVYKQTLAAPGLKLGNKVTTMNKRVAVTSANFDALHSAPLSLVPAPGAGKALLFHYMTFDFVYPASGGVQYTGGGAVIPVYHGATTDLSGTTGVPAAVVTGAATDVKFVPAISIVDVTANVGIDLYAGTANFAAGNGVAVVNICYSVVNLS